MIKNRWFKYKDIKISNSGDYIFQEASNLETGTATKRKIDYIDTDGVEYADIFYSERIFEIKAFIRATNEDDMVRLKRKLISSCSLKEKFELEYCNRTERYTAQCYFDKLPTFQKRTGWNLPFTLYLTIPGFYWQSKSTYRIKLFGYRDVVFDTFTLPCVFTERVYEVDLINKGDCETYPVFTVSCDDEPEDNSIIIKNLTTDKSITINYEIQKDEILTVDTFNQTVTSSVNGNITGNITLDTEFFSLVKGVNKITCVSLGNVVTAEFKENFFGV